LQIAVDAERARFVSLGRLDDSDVLLSGSTGRRIQFDVGLSGLAAQTKRDAIDYLRFRLSLPPSDRSAAGPQAGFEPEPPHGGVGPARVAERAVAVNVLTHRVPLRRRL
jgi:hypothetical protein